MITISAFNSLVIISRHEADCFQGGDQLLGYSRVRIPSQTNPVLTAQPYFLRPHLILVAFPPKPSSPPRVLHSLLVQLEGLGAGLIICYEMLHSRLHKTKYEAQQIQWQ